MNIIPKRRGKEKPPSPRHRFIRQFMLGHIRCIDGRRTMLGLFFLGLAIKVKEPCWSGKVTLTRCRVWSSNIPNECASYTPVEQGQTESDPGVD